MPYTGASDPSLPANVKSLPENKRAQWVHVFNSSFSRCQSSGGTNCEQVAFRNANGVAKASEFDELCSEEGPIPYSTDISKFKDPPDWINVMPRPGRYIHPRYGDLVITPETNKRFVDNFQKKVYQETLPVDTEHDIESSGAVGWITEMRGGSDGSVEAKVDWNDRGKALLKEDRFRYFSAAWKGKWIDPVSGEEHRDVLIGGALVTRPFFKEKSLRPLVAKEERLWDMNEEGTEGEPLEFSAAKAASKDDSEEGKMADPKKVEIAEDELTVLRKAAEDLKVIAADRDALKAKLGEDSEVVPKEELAALKKFKEEHETSDKEGETEAKKLKEDLEAKDKRIQVLEESDKTRRFRDVILGRDETSVNKAKEDKTEVYPMVGDLAGKLSVMRTLADAKGEDSEEFKSFVASERSHAEQLRKAGLFNEIGTGGQHEASSATEEFDAAVKKFAEDNKVDLGEATEKVAKASPDLYNRYSKERARKIKEA